MAYHKIYFTINGDTNYLEADETFTVTLSNPVDITINDGTGTVTITNDDAEPSILVADVSATESSGENTSVQIPVELDHASAFEISVNYVAVADTASVDDFTARNREHRFEFRIGHFRLFQYRVRSLLFLSIYIVFLLLTYRDLPLTMALLFY